MNVVASSPLRWLRLLAHGLLCAVLLLGVVDIHPDKESPEPLAGAESVYFPAAAHPGQPVHMETASPVAHPRCAACLLHLQTRGAHLQSVSAILPPAALRYLQPVPESRAVRGVRSLSGARAPPLS